MKIWIDAQLSPGLAPCLRATFEVDAAAVRELGLRDASDAEIFQVAAAAGATILTKDLDFIGLVASRGTPPQVILLRCGNTSNKRLREMLTSVFRDARKLIEAGEAVVEISG